jgi:hypothetical protein
MLDLMETCWQLPGSARDMSVPLVAAAEITHSCISSLYQPQLWSTSLLDAESAQMSHMTVLTAVQQVATSRNALGGVSTCMQL